MRCEFLGADSPLWSRFLADSTHDFYHLPQYVALSTHDRLSAPDGNGISLAFHAEDDLGHRFLSTLIARPVPAIYNSNLSDAITPYGYACPLVINNGDSPVGPFLREAIKKMAEGLRSRGIVSAFFRSHPTISLPIEALNEAGCLVQHGQTVCIDLTLDEKELWHQTRQDHRSGINKAKRNGFTVEVQPDWRDFESFFQAYTETMHRVNANEFYFFSRDYFHQLREAVGHVLHLAVCHKDGVVACAGIFTEVCGIVQYHLSGTIEQFRSQFPTKLMLDFVRTWAKARGNQTMHLGGGYAGSEDSLFMFKAGFSHVRAPFYTWRLIADPDAYQQLCQQWEARTGKTASPPSGYFPAFRAPD